MTVAHERLLDGFPFVVSRDVIRDVLALLLSGGTGEAIYAVPQGRRLLDLEGLGKDAREGVDPKCHIDELRVEWDNR
jgi:hypothetical protein